MAKIKHIFDMSVSLFVNLGRYIVKFALSLVVNRKPPKTDIRKDIS